MDKIENLSDLAPIAYGAIAFATLRYIGKLLTWCGRKIAEGANKDLIKKLMPSIAEYVEGKIREFKDELTKDLMDVKMAVEEYRKVKHDIETENKYLKNAIEEDDKELLEIIKNHLKSKNG